MKSVVRVITAVRHSVSRVVVLLESSFHVQHGSIWFQQRSFSVHLVGNRTHIFKEFAISTTQNISPSRPSL